MRAIEIGFCWTFPAASARDGLRRLRDLSFDGIELWPDKLEEIGAAAWAEALKETGLRVLQLCPYFNFMGGDPTIAKSRELLQQSLADAEVLGCKRLRVFTGPPWGEGVVGPRDATPRQWEDSISTLRDFCDAAGRQGVELCLECHEGSLMEDSPSALRLLRGVDRANLTTNLQLPLVNEDSATSVKSLGAFTTHIHIHNWTEGPNQGDLTFLEEGVLDWKPIVRELLAARKDPLTLSLEHVGHGGRHDPWDTARRDGAYLNALRSELRL